MVQAMSLVQRTAISIVCPNTLQNFVSQRYEDKYFRAAVAFPLTSNFIVDVNCGRWTVYEGIADANVECESTCKFVIVYK